MTEPPYLHRTRVAYNTVAADYARRFTEFPDKPLDRALLVAFAELVRAAGDGPVADLGCGPGYLTAFLHSLGLTVFGVDLSAEMVAQARRAHPGLRFDEGSMTDLDLPDGALGGIAALYSIIHIPTDRLPALFAGFHRVLAPGGHLLLAFQVGDERQVLTEWFGHEISLEYHRRPPEQVADLLRAAGFTVPARLLREPDGDVEKVPRACLLAAKPQR